MTIKIVRRTPTTHFTGDLHPLLQRIYANRSVSAQENLDRSLAALISYQQLFGIQSALELLFTALKEQQRIIIVGDFDADGATSTALAISVLRMFGAKHVDYIVPNRFEYGYGLTPEIVALAATNKPDLLITVDNGISSIAGVAAANALGIKVLITDHHLAGQELPNAAAIINPNQPQATFPSKHLAGVGVIFYVLLALRSYLRNQGWFAEHNIVEPNMSQFLDLVALGTVADVVMLDQNNRILVHQGIQRIRAGKCRPGITALIEISKRTPQNLVASDLGFALGPRLNAAGRLDDMSLGINCLLSTSLETAREMATTLDSLNIERRAIEQSMKQQAFIELDKLSLDQKDLPVGLCLYDETWHQGVIGILASRIKDRWHRPTIAFAAVNDDEIKGSARSIKGLHIRDVLADIASQHPGLITKFGGHAMAAGLSLPRDKYHQFAQAFDQQVKQHLHVDDLYARIDSDGELAEADITLQIAELIQQAGPWGQGFPEPMFDGEFDLVDQRMVGSKHLKMILRVPGGTHTFHAIAFNVDLNNWPNYHCQRIVAAYRLNINEYNGFRNLQLIIEHLDAS